MATSAFITSNWVKKTRLGADTVETAKMMYTELSLYAVSFKKIKLSMQPQLVVI
jgi:hypothetical protein